MVTFGGAALRSHWDRGAARSALNDPRFMWDFVVLQEHGRRPFQKPEESFEMASRFRDEIVARGAVAVWHMTHPYHSIACGKEPAERTPTPHHMYAASRNLAVRVQVELGMRVAPVGEAWWAYQLSSPEREGTMDLYHADGFHPSPLGTYLSACVLYAVLLNTSPVGLPPMGFTAAKRIQKLAEGAVAAFGDRGPAAGGSPVASVRKRRSGQATSPVRRPS
jgi:hypothetical protein